MFMQSLSIESMPVSRLRPHAGNARTHSRKQIRQIANSIERFGFTNPVLISDDGQIIAGHGRVEAAKLLRIEGPVLQEQKDAEDALRGKWLEFERDLGKIESRLKAQSHD